MHAPLCGIFHPNSVAVARYGALIRAKYPTIFLLYTEWWGISRKSRIVCSFYLTVSGCKSVSNVSYTYVFSLTIIESSSLA
ncbi:DUF6783 domain-containing protein [Blautia wexlerae]|uniref:DUF6783 domain-containing protein n=1 Tax=Blautia wexlerae TaxID=418240 RepID=UPI002E37AC23|nr:DUF6783 domain-containing protein [Blautia wexlerae]